TALRHWRSDQNDCRRRGGFPGLRNSKENRRAKKQGPQQAREKSLNVYPCLLRLSAWLTPSSRKLRLSFRGSQTLAPSTPYRRSRVDLRDRLRNRPLRPSPNSIRLC